MLEQAVEGDSPMTPGTPPVSVNADRRRAVFAQDAVLAPGWVRVTPPTTSIVPATA